MSMKMLRIRAKVFTYICTDVNARLYICSPYKEAKYFQGKILCKSKNGKKYINTNHVNTIAYFCV